MLRIFFFECCYQLIEIILKNFIGGSSLIKESEKLNFLLTYRRCAGEIMVKFGDLMNRRFTYFGVSIMSQRASSNKITKQIMRTYPKPASSIMNILVF